MRIGYAPYSFDLSSPGDRRRFPAYAKARGINYEIAKPSSRYDLVVVSGFSDLSAWSRYPYGRIVFDYIDANLSISRLDLRQWLRGVVWYGTGRHERLVLNVWRLYRDMCSRSDAVVCPNNEQYDDVTNYCSNAHIILDIPEFLGGAKKRYKINGAVNLLWEGLPVSIKHLRVVRDALNILGERYELILHILTDYDRPRFLGRYGRVVSIDEVKKVYEKTVIHEWTLDNLLTLSSDSDIGIIPIDCNNRQDAAKPENKLLHLWRLGLPVVTSSTESYQRAMRNAGISGLTCSNTEEWVQSLNALISSEMRREVIAQKGGAYVCKNYSENIMLEQWDLVFASIGLKF